MNDVAGDPISVWSKVVRYIVSHWRGEQGLSQSCLLNGLMGYLVATLTTVALGLMLAPIGDNFAPVVGMAVYFAWQGWASVGIVRCVWRDLSAGGRPPLRWIMAGVAILMVLVVGILSVYGLLTTF